MKLLYVNSVELEKSNILKDDNYNCILDYDTKNHHKLHQIPCNNLMEQLEMKKLIKELEPSYAINDRYMVPIFVHGLLMNTYQQLIYFADEYVGTGRDAISFIGGQCRSPLTQPNYLEKEMVKCIHYQMSHTGLIPPCQSPIDIKLALSNYNIDVNVDNSFRYCTYINDLNSKIKGLYFYIGMTINSVSDNLTFINESNWRTIRLLKERDLIDNKSILNELCSASINDTRVDSFDLITRIFETFGHDTGNHKLF